MKSSARPLSIGIITIYILFIPVLISILAHRTGIQQAPPAIDLGAATNAPRAEPATPAAVRFVDSQNNPLANQVIWVLCYGDEAATLFVGERLLTTDSDGFPQSTLPSNCPWLVALQHLHEQPAGKAGHGPAYRIYATSWRTGSGTPEFDAPGCSYGVAQCAIARAASGDIVIRQEWPLILFHIVVSLEWQPERERHYVAELRQGLQYASAYLADLTDGYMAFGPVTIYTRGRMWESADLRFHSANDLRPAAFMGGLVDAPRLYTSPATAQAAIFRPAATFYGRYWDGVDAHQGTWNLADGYRTLAHEWAHYALFLYDEYGMRSGRGGSVPTYCQCDDLPQLLNPNVTTVCGEVTRENAASALAFHYAASELWHPIHGSPPSCSASDQMRFHGETDWTMLGEWYEVQGLAPNLNLPPLALPNAPLPGPSAPVMSGPTLDLFGRSDTFKLKLPLLNVPGLPPMPTQAHTTTLHVQIGDTTSPTSTLVPQVYLLHNDASGNNEHLLYQGTLTGSPANAIGQIDLVGVLPDDELVIFVDRYTSPAADGARFIYQSPPNSTVQNMEHVTATLNGWKSSLDLVYSTTVAAGDVPGLLQGVTAILSGPHNMDFTQAPRAQICVPDAAIGCPAAWNQTMQLNSSGEWVASFAPLAGEDELPLYAVIRVVSTQARTDGLIRWLRDAGGVGPGHKIGNSAPLRDGLVMVDNIANPNFEPACNRVMVMPAANYNALLVPMAAEALVSAPLDIDILYGDDVNGACLSNRTTGEAEFPPLRLTLSYRQEEIERLGITNESGLRIIRHFPEGEEWVALTSTVDTTLNLVSARITEDGLYAIGWGQ